MFSRFAWSMSATSARAPGSLPSRSIDQAKRENIKVVFVQPQFDRRSAAQVARAIGGAVVAVDPLAADYVDNLRRVGREFAQALQP